MGPAGIYLELFELPNGMWASYSCDGVILTSVAQDVLEPYSFTLEKQKMLQNEIEKRVRLMIDDHVCDIESPMRAPAYDPSQFSNLITDAGINTVFETCKNHQNNVRFLSFPVSKPNEPLHRNHCRVSPRHSQQNCRLHYMPSPSGSRDLRSSSRLVCRT